MGRSRSPDRRRRSRSRSRSRGRDRSRSPPTERRRRRKNRFDEAPAGGSKWDMAPNPSDPAQIAAALALQMGRGVQPQSKQIMVPNRCSSSLIGRGGVIITQLKNDSGAKIQMQQKDEMAPDARERGMTLTGTPAQIAKAEELIMEIVSKGGGPPPPAAGGFNGGFGTPAAGGFNGGFGTPAAGGFGGDAANALTPLVVPVPMSAVGSIIGKGGSVIRKLMEDTGTTIRVQQKDDIIIGQIDRNVSVIGTPAQTEKAKALILEIVRETQQGGSGGGGGGSAWGGNSKKSITVRESDVGSLIGRGGSVIKGLIADSGCHIRIQSGQEAMPGNPNREVYLSGTDDQIAHAEKLVRALLPSENMGLARPSPYGAPPAHGPPRGYGAPPVPPSGYGAPQAPPPSSYSSASSSGYAPPANYNPYGAPPAGYGAPPSSYGEYGAAAAPPPGPPPPRPPPSGAPPANYSPYGAPPPPSNYSQAPPPRPESAPQSNYAYPPQPPSQAPPAHDQAYNPYAASQPPAAY